MPWRTGGKPKCILPVLDPRAPSIWVVENTQVFVNFVFSLQWGQVLYFLACYCLKKYILLSHGSFQWKTWIKIPIEFTCLFALLLVVGNESKIYIKETMEFGSPYGYASVCTKSHRYPNVIPCNSPFSFAGTQRMSSTHCWANTGEEKTLFEGSKGVFLQYTCANLWEARISPVKSESRSQNPHAHTA